MSEINVKGTPLESLMEELYDLRKLRYANYLDPAFKRCPKCGAYNKIAYTCETCSYSDD